MTAAKATAITALTTTANKHRLYVHHAGRGTLVFPRPMESVGSLRSASTSYELNMNSSCPRPPKPRCWRWSERRACPTLWSPSKMTSSSSEESTPSNWLSFLYFGPRSLNIFLLAATGENKQRTQIKPSVAALGDVQNGCQLRHSLAC